MVETLAVVLRVMECFIARPFQAEEAMKVRVTNAIGLEDWVIETERTEKRRPVDRGVTVKSMGWDGFGPERKWI